MEETKFKVKQSSFNISHILFFWIGNYCTIKDEVVYLVICFKYKLILFKFGECFCFQVTHVISTMTTINFLMKKITVRWFIIEISWIPTVKLFILNVEIKVQNKI